MQLVSLHFPPHYNTGNECCQIMNIIAKLMINSSQQVFAEFS